MRISVLLGCAFLAIMACEKAPGASRGAEPVKLCMKAGTSCVFDEGKLGLCVERSIGCQGDGCFVCQSQH